MCIRDRGEAVGAGRAVPTDLDVVRAVGRQGHIELRVEALEVVVEGHFYKIRVQQAQAGIIPRVPGVQRQIDEIAGPTIEAPQDTVCLLYTSRCV